MVMSYGDMNNEIFSSNFRGKVAAFADWLVKFLETGDAYPFVIIRSVEYDLSDLFKDLVRTPQARTKRRTFLEKSIRKLLNEYGNTLSVENLLTLSMAAYAANLAPSIKGFITTYINQLEPLK